MKNLKFEPELITRHGDYGALYACPICQYRIDTKHADANFCPQCGIKFTWDTEQSEIDNLDDVDNYRKGVEAIEKLRMIENVLDAENENWIGSDYMDAFEQIKTYTQ